jgi:1-aminocyclopropane-1-carboxylate deaminase/D-cysteine desulfhydrase-like pyridoxal-dependent ACC family enzyme
MHLKFVSRKDYEKKEVPRFIEELEKEFGEFLMVPEGGFHPLGAAGAAHIHALLKEKDPSHVCLASGTATTLAGLVLGANPVQQVIGVSVLKGFPDLYQRVALLTGQKPNAGHLQLLNGYHFGGYARYTPELIDFMNTCWKKFNLPLDFVYTAKMLYAVFEEARRGAFPEGSRVICLHTGGLQGNRSLPPDTLLY